ncbi:zinc finger BED domain-containing protein 4-like [Sycon ciliatum]|uniref:zinc finger BED domain-containing protein 4-like n=1 Tax=Sycon ciliatum TaxID=27933 RepID=UPI0031F6197F
MSPTITQQAAENGWESNVCIAHRLQTAIRHALDLDVVAKLLSRCRKLVGHFKHSCLAAGALESKQRQLNADAQPLKVIQDVPTRWNSAYYMIDRLLKLRVALTAVLCDSSITSKQTDRDLLLKDNQWKLAEQLVHILEPFESATSTISGQKYVTLSLLFPITCHLLSVMEGEHAKPLTTAAKSVAAKLKSELIRKFPNVSCPLPTSMPVVCAALDPRFRSLQFLDDDKASAAKDHVKSLLAESAAVTSASEPPRKKACVTSGGLSRLFGRSQPSKDVPSTTNADAETRLRDREVELFFTEDDLDVDDSPLEWWRKNEHRFPGLSTLARRYLSVLETSVPSERIFSAAGRLVTKLCNGLSPAHIDASIFLSVNSVLPGARYQKTSSGLNSLSLAEELEEEELSLPELPSLSGEISDDE